MTMALILTVNSSFHIGVDMNLWICQQVLKCSKRRMICGSRIHSCFMPTHAVWAGIYNLFCFVRHLIKHEHEEERMWTMWSRSEAHEHFEDSTRNKTQEWMMDCLGVKNVTPGFILKVWLRNHQGTKQRTKCWTGLVWRPSYKTWSSKRRKNVKNVIKKWMSKHL